MVIWVFIINHLTTKNLKYRHDCAIFDGFCFPSPTTVNNDDWSRYNRQAGRLIASLAGWVLVTGDDRVTNNNGRLTRKIHPYLSTTHAIHGNTWGVVRKMDLSLRVVESVHLWPLLQSKTAIENHAAMNEFHVLGNSQKIACSVVRAHMTKTVEHHRSTAFCKIWQTNYQNTATIHNGGGHRPPRSSVMFQLHCP